MLFGQADQRWYSEGGDYTWCEHQEVDVTGDHQWLSYHFLSLNMYLWSFVIKVCLFHWTTSLLRTGICFAHVSISLSCETNQLKTWWLKKVFIYYFSCVYESARVLLNWIALD